MSKLPEIIIVDDHTLFREGIRLLIENENIGHVIAEAGTGKEFLELLKDLNPDLVLMDIEMPLMDGFEATEKAKFLKPALKVLVLSMQGSKNDYSKMINAGATGFVLKTAGKYELERAIKTVLNGEHYFSNEILHHMVNDYIKQPQIQKEKPVFTVDLTEKEMEVLQLLCKGLTTIEIAETIHRSVKTVEAHRARLLEKTNSKNTISLVMYAVKNKLVNL